MHRTPDPDVAVDIRELTTGYERGVAVLEDFSARIDGPGVVVVRGRNGSGKSTLVEVCSGYLKPWRGTVRIRGIDAHLPMARQRRRICRTEPALYPHMTARDHLVFAARCQGVSPQAGLARAARYEMGPWLEYDAKSLSTGNRRKLWLIMCTLGTFDVVVLDEPFNGLDSDGREMLVAEIRGWASELTVVLSVHGLPASIEADQTVFIGSLGDDERTGL
jgi:ABC-type multidrug transport system ATPase subunit